MRACSQPTPLENLPSHRFPWRFSELILCQLVQLHVSSWKHGVWLAWPRLLHGFLLLPRMAHSAVDHRGNGATTTRYLAVIPRQRHGNGSLPDACA